jgi:hypothetical protein
MHYLKNSMLQFPHSGAAGTDRGSLYGWRHHLWLILLVAASVAFSLGFACATPLAAFSAAAALSLDRRYSLLLTLAVWFANQFVGFTLLRYPWTSNSLGWGLALGIAAILATLAAHWAKRLFKGTTWIADYVAAFLAAFAIFEGVLFVVGLLLLGGMEDFAPGIVGRIFAINSAAFLGLLILNWLARVSGFVPVQVRNAHR